MVISLEVNVVKIDLSALHMLPMGKGTHIYDSRISCLFYRRP